MTRSGPDRKAWRRASLAADKARAEKAAAEKLAAEKAAAAKAAAEKATLMYGATGGVAAALLALVLAMVFWRLAATRRVERDAIQAKFAPITDVEGRLAPLKAEESKEEAAVAELRKAREELVVTVKSLTEDLDVMDHGVYQPHFEFTTSDEYKRAMDSVYAQKKAAVSDGTAATCSREWVVDGSKIEGRRMTKQNTKVMLRAFNSEVEAAVANVSWSNVKTKLARFVFDPHPPQRPGLLCPPPPGASSRDG